MTDIAEIGTFIQPSPYPAWLADFNGRCVYANPALERLTGLSSTQLTQMTWLDLLVQENRPDAMALWQHSRAAAIPYRVRVCILRTNTDDCAPVELIALGHRSTRNRELWLFTALHLETSTRQHPPLESQLQATLNVIPIQAWYAAPGGTLKFLNEAAATYLGLPQFHHLRFGTEVGGNLESHLAFVHREDRTNARKTWATSLRKEEIGEVQLRLLNASGDYQWFLTRVEPLRAKDGRLLYWVGVNINIDDEKRAGAALNAARERIARAAQFATIAELSASIADEIVQPVSAVVANARASLNWLSGKAPNIVQARAAMEGILRDGMSIGKIVYEMRQLFKRQLPDKKRIQVNQLIYQVIKVSDTDLRNHEITVSLELSPDLPPIEADAVQIEQVLLNLIRNATEAVVAQSSRPREVTIRTLYSEQSVTVEVDDNGAGIADPERTFEAFLTNNEESLEVRFSISLFIATAHGGTLVAANREDGGARFSLTLPRNC